MLKSTQDTVDEDSGLKIRLGVARLVESKVSRRVSQLTTLLKQIVGSGSWSSKVRLQPLNITIQYFGVEIQDFRVAAPKVALNRRHQITADLKFSSTTELGIS